MLYLLDANVLITAHDTYYPLEGVPEFWDWLLHQARNNLVKIPVEMMEEVNEGHKDSLLDWLSDSENKGVLLLEEEVDINVVRHVVSNGYGNGLTDDQITKLGCDPFLIAYAKAQADRCVVTSEGSKPSKTGHNRHIPDVCNSLNVKWCDPFSFYKALGFTTSWRG
jgi:hypothetical protein